MKKTKIYSSVLLFFLLLSGVVSAQQVGSNSPYGRYGLGMLSEQTFGVSQAMGGVSYALRNNLHINPGNPASYSAVDSVTFIFDFGISGQYSIQNDASNKAGFWDGSFDYVALKFRLNRRIGFSTGLLPYSKIGYRYGAVKEKENIKYMESYDGSGSISKLYSGVSFKITDNISIGSNLGYYFGETVRRKELPSFSEQQSLARTKVSSYKVNLLKFDIGTQFTIPLSKKRNITIGATYSPKAVDKTNVNVNDFFRFSASSSSSSQEVKDNSVAGASIALPNVFGLGIAYKAHDRLLVAVDGTFSKWKGLEYPSVIDGLTDENRYNNQISIKTGIEYSADPYSSYFLKRIRYRGGLSFSNSYINAQVPGGQGASSPGAFGYDDYGVTAGFGIPLFDNYSGRVSILSVGFGYQRLQPRNKIMVAENIFKMTVSMNINDFWFFKQLL